MTYWVYKNNSEDTSYSSDSGDWGYVFEEPWRTVPWGSLEQHRDLTDLSRGDILLCQQSDVPGKLLVGLARVEGVRGGDVLVRAIEQIGARIKPLKDADPRIARIPALQGGIIKSVYDISDRDAQRLLRAARAQAAGQTKPAKWKPADEREVKQARKMLGELPASERHRVMQEITRLVRNALLRDAVLAHWPARCAVCGCRIEVDSKSECEIAHIKEVRAAGHDQVRNALPLCRTHHWAFDKHAWAIRPSDHRIVVRKSLRRNPALRRLHGKRIIPPRSSQVEFLAANDLTWRWRKFLAAASEDI